MGTMDPNMTPEEEMRFLMGMATPARSAMGMVPSQGDPGATPLMPETQKASSTPPTSAQTRTVPQDDPVNAEQQFGMPNQYRSAGALLASQADIHNNKAMDLLKQSLATQAEVTPSQALAAGVLALVPTLGGYMAGRAVGSPKLSPHLRMSVDDLATYGTGGAQGAMTGLAAGTQAAQGYLGSFQTNLDKQNKTRQEMAGLESKMGQEETDFQHQLIANAAQQSDALRNAKELKTFEHNLEGNQGSRITPEMVADIATRTGKTPEQVLAEVSLPKDEFYKLQNYAYREGGNVKPPGTEMATKLEAQDSFKYAVGQMRKYAQQMQGDPGFVQAVKAGKVTDAFKVPGSPAYLFYAWSDLAKKTLARQNDSGALTQLDVEMFNPLVVGSPVYDTPESIMARIDELDKYSDMKAQSVITRAGQTGRNVTGVKAASSTTVPPTQAAPTQSTTGNTVDEIDALVKAGKMTEEEAKAKFRAIYGG